MRLYYIKPIAASALLLSLGMAGCLKDKAYDNGQIQSVHAGGSQPAVVELSVAATNSSNFLGLSFDAFTHDTTINLVPVTLATADAAPEDINVTLVQADSLVKNYNTKNGTAYAVPASSMFTLLNAGGVVTIAKGSHVGYLRIKFTPTNFIGSDWALGYTIKSIDKPGYTISGNMNIAVVAIGIKNKYDGQYSMIIKTVGWSAFAIADGVSGTWPSNIGLVTAGATSVTIFDYLRGDNLQPAFTSGLSATAFGAATPLFTFDASDKLISVTNTTPDDGRGRSFHLNAAITTSRYDAATKTIYAAYIMTQNSRPDQQIYDTLVYVKSR